MNAETIKQWLEAMGKDRRWLAQAVGFSKPTVDGWLSSGRRIPKSAALTIERLMREADLIAAKGGFKVDFSAEEFEEIEGARKLSGHRNRSEFYHDAVMDYAREILENERRDPLEAPIPFGRHDERSLRVAETPPATVAKKQIALSAGKDVKYSSNRVKRAKIT